MLVVYVCSAAAVVVSGQPQQSKAEGKEMGCFEWTKQQLSVAGNTFEYLPAGSSPGDPLQQAVQGNLIDLTCAGAVCPSPPVPNCYFDASVCSDDEWCMLDTQALWGPFGMGTGGWSPGSNGKGGFQCDTAQAAGMTWWWTTVCSQNASWGPWESMRGRCVRYREEQQSCQEDIQVDHSIFGPQYATRPDGRPFERAMRCRPDLVCTGDVEPTPHTCVKRRPADVCYSGPWWNSTWCKVGGGAGGEYKRGLPQPVLEEAAQALLLQLPQEHMQATQETFWYSAQGNRSREIIENIVEILWPEAYRENTSFPLSYPDPRQTGPAYTAAWNATASSVSSLIAQTPRVWSTVHMLVANTKKSMDQVQVEASQSLALWLSQNFICPHCRGHWRTGVLDVIGLPPSSPNRIDHIKWWWRAHNMVSEHTASTRGGDSWVYPALPGDQFAETIGRGANNTKLLNCQNPFFLPWDDAIKMWSIDPEDI